MTAADESDLCLLSACLLLGLDHDDVEERASIIEYDGGMTREGANREALFLAMTARGNRHSRKFVGDFLALAGPAVEREEEHGLPRAQTIAWMLENLAAKTVEILHTEESTLENHIRNTRTLRWPGLSIQKVRLFRPQSSTFPRAPASR